MAVYSVIFHLQANTNLPYTLTDTTLYPGAIDTWRNSRWFPDSKCLFGFICLPTLLSALFSQKPITKHHNTWSHLAIFTIAVFFQNMRDSVGSQILTLCGNALIHRSHRAIGHDSWPLLFSCSGRQSLATPGVHLKIVFISKSAETNL